jgi:general secretion pathway protein F
MRFDVKVVSGRAAPTVITVEALNAKDAATQAKGLGYTVLGTVQQGMSVGRLLHRRSRFPVLLFSQELVALLNAGLTLVEAIQVVAEKEARADIARVLDRVLCALKDGLPLSAALEAQGDAFPSLYLGTVRASERTGQLPEAIQRFVVYQQQIELLKKKVISASLYPLLLTAVGMLVLAFLLIYVVPRFSQIYQDRGESLPLLSRMLIQWGTLVGQHGTLVFFTIIMVLLGAAATFGNSGSRTAILKMINQLPGVRAKFKIYHLARFYRTMAMLLRGGMPMVPALGVVAGVVDHLGNKAVIGAREAIERGVSLSEALASAGLTTPVSLRLLKVGERTGGLDVMLTKIAEFHEEETARLVDWVVRVFEPALMVFMGLVIGGVVVLMYMPIFELAGAIG